MMGIPGNGVSRVIDGPLVTIPRVTPEGVEQWQSASELREVRRENKPPLDDEDEPIEPHPDAKASATTTNPPATERRIDISDTPVSIGHCERSDSSRSVGRMTNIDLKRFCADFVRMQLSDLLRRVKSAQTGYE